MYLGLGVSATRIPARKTTHGTLDTSSRSNLSFPYGAITLYGSPFQEIAVGMVSIGKSPNSTSGSSFEKQFGLPYTAFDRLY